MLIYSPLFFVCFYITKRHISSFLCYFKLAYYLWETDGKNYKPLSLWIFEIELFELNKKLTKYLNEWGKEIVYHKWMIKVAFKQLHSPSHVSILLSTCIEDLRHIISLPKIINNNANMRTYSFFWLHSFIWFHSFFLLCLVALCLVIFAFSKN